MRFNISKHHMYQKKIIKYLKKKKVLFNFQEHLIIEINKIYIIFIFKKSIIIDQINYIYSNFIIF